MRHRVVAAIAFAIVGLACMPTPALGVPLPVIYSGIYGYAHVTPTASPPGANNWSCKPTAAHPTPVILVHGTFAGELHRHRVSQR